MLRALLALLAVTGFAATAAAQPPVVINPGNQPGAPVGIGAGTVVRGAQPGVVYFVAIAPWGWATGWAYWNGSSYTFGGYLPPDGAMARPAVVAAPAPAAPARNAGAGVVLANEFPATLTVQFPAPADVWLGGRPVKGDAAEERVLTSPVLRAGDEYTFDLKARWTRDGKTYESTRRVTLGAGDRSRLVIVSGAEVK